MRFSNTAFFAAPANEISTCRAGALFDPTLTRRNITVNLVWPDAGTGFPHQWQNAAQKLDWPPDNSRGRAVLGCICESKTSWPRLVPRDKTTATRFSPPCCVHTAECRIAGSTGKISLALVRELNLVWPRQDAVRLCANAYQETPFLMRQGWAESQPSPG